MSHLITLQQIRDARPCAEGWAKLLTTLGENHAAPDLTRLVSIGDVAQSNGAADALWCCRLIGDRRAVVRAIMPTVKRAAAHTTDERVHNCITVVERWLDGDDGVDLRAAVAVAVAAASIATATTTCAAATLAAARAAAWAARAAADAATALALPLQAEHVQQVADIIAVFPLHALDTQKEAA